MADTVSTVVTSSVVLLAVVILAVVVVPMVPGVNPVGTRAAVTVLSELCGQIGLLLDVLVHKVADVMRTDVHELRHLDAASHSRQDLRIAVDRPDAVLDSDGLLCSDEV